MAAQGGDTDVSRMDHVISILNGYKPTLVVVNACKAELFDKVHSHSGPCTASSLAAAHGWHAHATQRLLNALVSMGFLEKRTQLGQDDVYTVAPPGLFLVRTQPNNVWNFAAGIPHMLDQYDSLASTLKTGKGDHKSDGHDHDSQQHGDHEQGEHKHGDDEEEDKYMKYLNTCPPSELMEMYEWDFNLLRPYLEDFFRREDFSWCRKVLDLGGGNGELAFALSAARPDIDVTVFEAPPVAKMLRENFLPLALESNPNTKISVVEGDFFKDAIPKADLYVLSNVIHGMEEKKCVKLLKLALDNLGKGGRLLLVEKTINNNGVGPLSAHLLDLQHCGGFVRTEKEFQELLSSVGFSDIRIIHPSDLCSVDFIMATK